MGNFSLSNVRYNKPESFNPGLRDFATGGALLAANPYYNLNRGEQEFNARMSGVLERFTSWGGIAQTVSMPLLMMGSMSVANPRIQKIMRGFNVTSFGWSLFLSTVLLSAVTTTAMTALRTGTSLAKREEFRGLETLKQAGIGMLYSVPSMMIGMGATQAFGFGILFFQDLALEPLQALAAVGTSQVLGLVDPTQVSSMSFSQQLIAECVDGVSMMCVGRGLNGGMVYAKQNRAEISSYKDEVAERLRTGQRMVGLNQAGMAEVRAWGIPDTVDVKNPPWIIAPWKDPKLQPIYYGPRSDGLDGAEAGRVTADALQRIVNETSPVDPRWEAEYGQIVRGLRRFIGHHSSEPGDYKRLSKLLLEQGLGQGVKPFDRTPYVVPVPFDVIRGKDGVRFDPAASPYFDPIIDGDTPHVIFDTQAAVKLLSDADLSPEIARSVRGMMRYEIGEADTIISDRPYSPESRQAVRNLFVLDAEQANKILQGKKVTNEMRDKINMDELDAHEAMRVVDEGILGTTQTNDLRKLLTFDTKAAIELLATDNSLPIPLRRRINKMLGFNARAAADLFNKALEGADDALFQKAKELFVIDQAAVTRLLESDIISGWHKRAVEDLREGHIKFTLIGMISRKSPKHVVTELQKLISFDAAKAQQILADKSLPLKANNKLRKLLSFDRKASKQLLDYEPLTSKDAEMVRKFLLFDAEEAVELMTKRDLSSDLVSSIKKLLIFDTEAANRLAESGELPDDVTAKIAQRGQLDSKVALDLLTSKELPQQITGKLQSLMVFDAKAAANLLADPEVPHYVARQIRALATLNAEAAYHAIQKGGLSPNTVEVLNTLLSDTGLMRDSITPRMTLFNTTEATHEALQQAGHKNMVLPPEYRCARGEVGAYGGWKYLKELVELHGNQVYLRVYEWDTYGRPVSEILVKKGPDFDKSNPIYDPIREITLANDSDPYINLNLGMTESGWGHTYVITPDGSKNLAQFLSAQDAARAAKRGVWANDHFRKAKLFITSNHSYKHHNVDDVRSAERARDKPVDSTSEYLRLFNTSDGRINLKGHSIRNGENKWTIDHDFYLEQGQGVKVYTHASPYQTDRFVEGQYQTTSHSWKDSAEMFIDLKLDVGVDGNQARSPEVNYWDEDLPLEWLDAKGRALSADAASQKAYEGLSKKFKELRGFHF